jgi:hypothetical protein
MLLVSPGFCIDCDSVSEPSGTIIKVRVDDFRRWRNTLPADLTGTAIFHALSPHKIEWEAPESTVTRSSRKRLALAETIKSTATTR